MGKQTTAKVTKAVAVKDIAPEADGASVKGGLKAGASEVLYETVVAKPSDSRPDPR